MSFRIDKQTIKDIELFSENEKTPSLFGFYNRTETIGGQEQLFKVIRTPFSDRSFLENRKVEIKYILGLKHSLKLNRRQFDFAEYYLKNRRIPLKNNIIDATRDSIANKLKASNDYYVISEGILHLSNILNDFKKYLKEINNTNPPPSIKEAFSSSLQFINDELITKSIENMPDDSRKIKSKHINLLDNLFRAKKAKELRSVLDTIYEIDVLQSHCKLIREEQFCLPEYSSTEDPIFRAEECIHPLLQNPIPNSFYLSGAKSLCFVTGPNMSGKSTFLKTVGVLVYFAHLGIPVPAKKLQIPIFNGLFTTINLSDSLIQGFSHFSTEVNRVKSISLEIQKNKNIAIILDELFRGTNVKDAYDGTLMVVKSMSKIRGAFFFVSTHILEVAEYISKSDSIDFRCFESILQKDKPVYDYKLKEGVTNERVGMQIIKNEKIEEILNGIIKSQN
ncbi:MAG: hypothetical protein R6U11_00570 [Bacteroidales bacterium]